MMKHYSVPLIEALKDHQRKSKASFHVPGHKNGAFFHESIYNDFKRVLPYDLTEIEGLDDLHAPEGVIEQAQQLTARLYGAKRTFFLVGGTTAGNIAMVYALFERGDVVFVQRDSHKSVFHAVQIAGVIPILLAPDYDSETDVSIGISVETLEKAIHLYPEAKGLLVTYPNYYGVSRDLRPVVELAKQHNLTVLVDEAHAAHYTIGKPFPPSALDLGADVVVQSAHKMLPALTMSSYLHIGSGLHQNEVQQIEESLAMFQSSSPSYLLMASLDGARAYLEAIDDQKVTEIIMNIKKIIQQLSTIKQINIINWSDKEQDYQSDPLKVTIKSNTSLTGFELLELFNEIGLYAEMADEKHVLLVFGLGDINVPDEAFQQLKARLLPYESANMRVYPTLRTRDKISKVYYLPNEVQVMKKRNMPIHDSKGKLSGETVVPYPPGVPILLTGEKISQETILKIEQLGNAGARFQGIEGKVETLLVIEEE